MNIDQTTPSYEQTDRTMRFAKTLNSEQDIQGLADRIAQPVGTAMRRDESDAVLVYVWEKTAEGEKGFQSEFGGPINSENDVEAIVRRILNMVSSAYSRGEIAEVSVGVVECEVAFDE